MRLYATQERGEASAADVRRQVEEVLARKEFDWDRDSLLDRIGAWLSEHIDLPGLPASWAGLEWILLAPLIAAAAWGLLRLARHLRSLAVEVDPGASVEADRVAERVAELLASARAASAAGDRVLALRHYFFALVVGLGRRGELEYRDTWTNRELLERGQPTAEISALLTPLVGDLDAKGFGAVPTSEADVAYLEDLCSRWLETVGGSR